MDTVADRVKHLRKQLKLTQTTLGQCAGGISKQAVSQWERGITEPQWEALNALQRACGVNPYWLLHGTAPMLESEHTPSADATPVGPSPPGHPGTCPLAELLDDLSRRLAAADPAVRDEVTRLVLRYLENPPAGARIAKAIELLLGEDENLPPA
ncbi:helix-turn-helix domain-containing protein [Thiorhodococcus minor]|uniref:Helix-turn-helix transcriptional regulator n=1 Tax=Thiorhodococcus minor TaxID=57489 RepID=A0A6M0K7G1_9GAMM|nr:helix-turn-helix transcriptional regulator [Thiorhodococcus minor]NEV65244.1 helix-turn-helix transcriptional regulator [Thiorhodococcus minor]